MTTNPAYERDPYLAELATEVIRVGSDGGRPYAVLADTVCYPEGGGQPADRGWIGDVAVEDVRRVGVELRHYIAAAAAAAPGAVTLRLDWRRRFDHMQQHTAQHLLTALAHDGFGWPTTAFHLGVEASDIELDAPRLEAAALIALEDAANAEIRAARPVTRRWVAAEQLEALRVRTRGLPSGHSGEVRLVEIEGVDLNTCGGTHVRSTAEIQCLTLLGTESLRGGTRLFFVAGLRALRRLAAHEQRCAELRALLGAPDAELPAVARAKLDELRRLERHLRSTEEELAVAAAALLASGQPRFVEAHFEGRELPFLQRVARQVTAAAPEALVLLTAAGAGDACFVVAAGEKVTADLPTLGRAVAEALGGRGGGSGRLAQGKAPSLAGRDAALQRLREAVSRSAP